VPDVQLVLPDSLVSRSHSVEQELMAHWSPEEEQRCAGLLLLLVELKVAIRPLWGLPAWAAQLESPAEANCCPAPAVAAQ